jgi:hypothetical protein
MATSQAAQTALSFFQGKGWSSAQAAGIVGNLQAESGLNPQAFNGAGGGRGAAGIAQWRGSRQTDFQEFAGVPLSQSTYQQQLDFVNYELTQGKEKAAGARLKATTTAADAATVVDKYYERSEGTDLQKRINNANALTGGGLATPNTQTPTEVAGEDYQATATRPGILYPIPNRLHEYPSYIYGLSLHMLSDEEYNDMVNSQTYTPKRVLIASAGRYSPDNFPRSEFFDRDFYFDDLNIVTTIAPNKATRNTNAIDLTFTIVEPYGFTLVERIIKTAKSVNSQNYLDQPYMLQIDFFTIDDAGKIVGSVEELRKRIPIKIIKFDVRVSGKGAEYRIQATAFGHSAFDTNTVTTPANFEVVAGSVAEFFQSIEGTPADTVPFAGNQVPGERAITEQNNIGPNFSGTANTTYTRVKSYGTAINEWNENLKINGKIGENDIYRFEFDDAISKSLFTHPDIVTPKRTRMQDARTPNDFVNIKRQGAGEEQAVYDPTKVIFQINYGTTIEKLLEYIIRNSDYIQNQLIIPEDPSYDQKRKEMAEEPLNWFRIVPTIRLRGFDNIRKVWAREITYTVKSYKIFNVRLDIAPQGTQLYPTKNYNYIYTGKNDDVFDFDINFNALYFSQITAYRNSMAELSPSADSNTIAEQTQNFPNYTGGAPSMEPNAIMPSILHPVVQNSKAAATGGATNTKEVASIDLADSLMTDSMADMVGLKLKILGDPDFIKQDDIFYKPTVQASITATPTKPTDDERLLPNNGSLVMDNGVVYAQVLFRTPVDIDESTGLMEFDPDYKTSLFSGLYQVIQVTSNFRSGQFTQELEMTRLPRQAAFDYTELQNTNGTERTERQEANPDAFPGKLGITQTPPIVPSLLQSGGPQQSTADASDSATNQTAGENQQAAQEANNVPPLLTQNAQDLRIVNETAPEETISDQTEPQAIAPNFTPISTRGNRVPGEAAVQ